MAGLPAAGMFIRFRLAAGSLESLKHSVAARVRGVPVPLILGIWAIPASIAISETFLSVAALLRLIRLARAPAAGLRLPSCLWFWLLWALLECAIWVMSPEPASGWSEIRHLLLLAVLFLTLPDLDRITHRITAWRGVFAVATLSSLVLIGEFTVRFFRYRGEIAAGGDSSFYLRSGGLVHHWMIYATLEIVVVAALITFWSLYREERRWWWPVLVLHAVAVVLSLTRMAWITCLILLGIHLYWRRSKWILALPLIPLVALGAGPDAVRKRLLESSDWAYFANAERLQMLKVGARMVAENPWTGVGPGRIEQLYTSYLELDDPVPAYHGHLHNNAVQIAAQFGIPVFLAAVCFVVVLFRDLIRARNAATTREARFLSEAALLSLTGFLVAGLFEYTYGHALGLIMISFAVLPALVPASR